MLNLIVPFWCWKHSALLALARRRRFHAPGILKTFMLVVVPPVPVVTDAEVEAVVRSKLAIWQEGLDEQLHTP